MCAIKIIALVTMQKDISILSSLYCQPLTFSGTHCTTVDHERVGNTGGPRKRGAGKVSTLDKMQNKQRVKFQMLKHMKTLPIGWQRLNLGKMRGASQLILQRFGGKSRMIYFKFTKKNCSGIG